MPGRPDDMGVEMTMDAATLYREEIFTDRKVGTIRVLTPVRADGSPDLGRKVVYAGEAQLLTTVGALPLSFEIEAQSLEDAVSKYAAAAQQAFERAVQELQEVRRQAASSIIVPDRGLPPLGPGGGPGSGGFPGGGRIKLS
jgi:regulator of protease activity HflC (stomatin/prohibitin superfamily)